MQKGDEYSESDIEAMYNGDVAIIEKEEEILTVKYMIILKAQKNDVTFQIHDNFELKVKRKAMTYNDKLKELHIPKYLFNQHFI